MTKAGDIDNDAEVLEMTSDNGVISAPLDEVVSWGELVVDTVIQNKTMTTKSKSAET